MLAESTAYSVRRRTALFDSAHSAQPLPSSKLPLNAGISGVYRLRDFGCPRAPHLRTAPATYSGFDSALNRSELVKWHFSQENATSGDLKKATLESKPL
jgi:hypothetical protein